MERSTKNRRVTKRGFTLIEILIAVVILSASMAIFAGIQAASIGATIRNREAFQAVLIARTIMSFVETRDSDLPFQNKSGSATQILHEVSEDETAVIPKEISDRFQVQFTVENPNIPNIDQYLLRRLILVISWGARADERIELNFYLPSRPDEL